MSESNHTEEWRDVVGYENRYRVSDRGRIVADYKARGYRAGRTLGSCARGDGYATVSLSKNGKAKSFLVHRIVLGAFRGLCPKGMNCNHVNGKKDDNRLANLEYVTFSENTRHAMEVLGFNERRARGLRNKSSKMTVDGVRAVRALYATGTHTYAQIAREYGVSHETIGAILRHKHWQHVA